MYENVKSEYREFDHNSTYMAEKSRDGITVAHNCHGKRINITAKRIKTSRQKEKDSRQKEKPHGKNGMVFKKLKHVTVSILQFGPQSRNVTVSG